MTALVGYPLGTVYNITNISKDKPARVTLSSVANPNSFAVTDGQTITISNVKGMYQINKGRFIVGGLDTDTMTFQLYDLLYDPVDTTSFSDYISGGQIDIVSYVPSAGQPSGLMFNNQ